MRPNSFILLAVIVLVTCVDAFSVVTASKMTLVDVPNVVHSFAENPQGTSSKRMLRDHEDTGDNDEERAGLAEFLKLKGFLFAGDNGLGVLKAFKVGETARDALQSPKLESLKTYVTMFNEKYGSKKTITLSEVLSTRYGDEDVARAIVRAQMNVEKAPELAEVATKLRTELLSGWLDSGKSVDSVFNLLKLSDDGAAAFASRKFEVLEEYIELFNKKNHGDESLVKIFTAGFGGEDKLLTAIRVARIEREPAVRNRALEMKAALLKQWHKDNLRPESVLKKLKLDDDVENALKSPNLRTLEKYIVELNQQNPNGELTLVGAFTAHYGDVAVARGLVSAQKRATSASSVQSIQNLRNEQLSGWLNGGKSVDDVFTLLKLHNDGFAALGSRKLEVLEDYIKLFNTEKSADESLVKVLTAGFGGEPKFVSMLRVAKTNFQTREKAIELEAGLFSQWRSENLRPESVLKLLNPNSQVESVLSNYNLRTFTKYVDDFNKNTGNEVSLLSTLTTLYGDDIVARALVSAKNVPSTESLATKLQTQQLEGWLKSDESVDDVFKILKLADDDFHAIGSRKLEALDDYIKLFNREKSGSETLLKALTTGFGGESELATILLTAKTNPHFYTKALELQTAQFKNWVDNGVTPTDIFVKIFKPSTDSPLDKTIAREYKTYYVVVTE